VITVDVSDKYDGGSLDSCIFTENEGDIITVNANSGYGNLGVYSCIFSENKGGRITAANNYYAGVKLYGSTFYKNNTGAYTSLLSQGSGYNGYIGPLYSHYRIYGCLFYGNYGNNSIRLLSANTASDFISLLDIQYNVFDVGHGTGTGQTGWPVTGYRIANNKTLAELGVSGDPLDPVTFRPKSSELNIGYSNDRNYSDFYGYRRNGTVGAVNY
jgi:hypothetical protein